jgi:cell division protein FtsQ
MTGAGGGQSTNERAAADAATGGSRRPGAAGRVSDLPARLYAARMRTRSRRRRLTVTLTVAACLFALAGYLLLWHTSLIAVRGVRVVGAKNVTVARILTAAQIDTGGPMAALDPASVAARIEAIPQVASAAVSRDWPGTVIVTVVERVPAALVPDQNGYEVVDGGGVIFGQVSAASAGLPVITVSAPARADEVVPGALSALRALPGSVDKTISAVTASDPYAITLRFTDGATVNWGGGDQAAEKARDLLALLRIGGHRHYDVSAPDAPAMS